MVLAHTMCCKGNETPALSLSVRGIAAQPAGGEDGRALGRLGATLQVWGMSTRKTAWAGPLLFVRYGNEAALCPTVFRRCRLSRDTPHGQRQYARLITFATHSTTTRGHH